MDTGRARDELGWAQDRTSEQTLMELLEGIRTSQGFPTPPLETGAGGPLRVRELATGVGSHP
jgi:hypothetical protein